MIVFEYLAAIAGVAFISTLLYLLARKPEKSALWTAVGIAMTFLIGLLFVLLVPSFNSNWSPNTADADAIHYHAVYDASQQVPDPANPGQTLPLRITDKSQIRPDSQLVGYTPLEQHGRLVYQREGCMYCHSQQIRPLDGEMKRYSIGTSLAIPADGKEYIWDQPHFLGTRRIGPDLSREGGKYSDDWHYSHFYYPRQMVPGSVMPQFTWLFTPDADGHPVPNADARALVAYIQTLGYGRQVPDGKGGWRSWLKASDQQYSQQTGATAVLRAKTPVLGHDQPSPTNRVLTPTVTQ